MTKEETLKLYKTQIDELKERIRLKECDIQQILERVWERLDGPNSFDNDPDVVVDAGRTIANYQQYIKDARNEIAKIEERLEQIDDLYFD